MQKLLILKASDGATRLKIEPDDDPSTVAAALKAAGLVEDRLLTSQQVGEMTGLARSTIYKKMAEGSFPKSVSPAGTSSARWRLTDIQAWLAALT